MLYVPPDAARVCVPLIQPFLKCKEITRTWCRDEGGTLHPVRSLESTQPSLLTSFGARVSWAAEAATHSGWVMLAVPAAQAGRVLGSPPPLPSLGLAWSSMACLMMAAGWLLLCSEHPLLRMQRRLLPWGAHGIYRRQPGRARSRGGVFRPFHAQDTVQMTLSSVGSISFGPSSSGLACFKARCVQTRAGRTLPIMGLFC